MMPKSIKLEKTIEDFKQIVKRKIPESVAPQKSQVWSDLNLESFEVTFQELCLHGKSNGSRRHEKGVYHMPSKNLGKPFEKFFDENILSWAREIGNLPQNTPFVEISDEQDLRLCVTHLKDIIRISNGSRKVMISELDRTPHRLKIMVQTKYKFWYRRDSVRKIKVETDPVTEVDSEFAMTFEDVKPNLEQLDRQIALSGIQEVTHRGQKRKRQNEDQGDNTVPLKVTRFA